MSSGHDCWRLSEGKRKEEGTEAAQDEAEDPPSAEPVDRKAEDPSTEKAVQGGRSEDQPDRSSKPLDPWDDTQPRQQEEASGKESPSEPEPQGEEPERSSPPPQSGFTGGDHEDKAMASLPWWAGAFGAIAHMGDSPEARGFYARRFCEMFFPDNTAGATEVGRVIPRFGVCTESFLVSPCTAQTQCTHRSSQIGLRNAEGLKLYQSYLLRYAT